MRLALSKAEAKLLMGDVRVFDRKLHRSKLIVSLEMHNSSKKNFKLFTAQVKLQRAYGGCLGTDSR